MGALAHEAHTRLYVLQSTGQAAGSVQDGSTACLHGCCVGCACAQLYGMLGRISMPYQCQTHKAQADKCGMQDRLD